jgi:nitroreductase
MNIVETIRERKSIRGFKPDPVSKEVIKEILDIAGHAPSAMNIQPWEFTVITGDALENIRKANVELLNSGVKPQPEHEVAGWPSESVYRKRQVELAKQLFQLMEIPRKDKKKRARWLERGFRFFDAPVAIIILADRALSESNTLLDIGSLMQNICLAALHYGIGTCIEDQGVMYPEVLRKFANIPESRRIIISIAVGYPDWDFPANKVKSNQESLDNITTWVGFK